LDWKINSARVPAIRKGTEAKNRIPRLKPSARFFPSAELTRAVLHIEHWATADEWENIRNTIATSAASRNFFFQIIFSLSG
jgi:hypothetical protein